MSRVHESSENMLAAVVLAAGGGSRCGGGKLTLPWRGRPLVAHAIEAAASVDAIREITVVVGHEGERVRAAVAEAFPNPPFSLRIVENAAWRDGQSTSLRLGMDDALRRGDSVCGVMVLLGDQPRVAKETVARLAAAYIEASSRERPPLAAAPVHNGKRGNPVILSPALRPAVARLEGDVGARHILAALGEELLRVPVDDPWILRDVDTREDYDDLRRE